MKQTLGGNPASFWYFNNGVTIVCDSARKTAERESSVLRVTNPQVINGQQTTRTIHSKPARQASVMVRVMSVPRDKSRTHSEFEQLVSNIVAATNWQNAILPSDLRANDVRQVALQRDLAKLRYHYLRKRQTKQEAKRLLGNQHWWHIKKDELAQIVGACEFDPVVVRSGKEGLFKHPNYDVVFDPNRTIREYLSMYWVGRVIKAAGSGATNRAYAKWYALHFLWQHVKPILRSRSAADAFRALCERNQYPRSVRRAADRVYRGLLDFYRQNRGKGPSALDASNFFYRPHQDRAFAVHWMKKKNGHRARFARALHELERELEKEVEV